MRGSRAANGENFFRAAEPAGVLRMKSRRSMVRIDLGAVHLLQLSIYGCHRAAEAECASNLAHNRSSEF
jgi:hypothetical protein